MSLYICRCTENLAFIVYVGPVCTTTGSDDLQRSFVMPLQLVRPYLPFHLLIPDVDNPLTAQNAVAVPPRTFAML